MNKLENLLLELEVLYNSECELKKELDIVKKNMLEITLKIKKLQELEAEYDNQKSKI